MDNPINQKKLVKTNELSPTAPEFYPTISQYTNMSKKKSSKSSLFNSQNDDIIITIQNEKKYNLENQIINNQQQILKKLDNKVFNFDKKNYYLF